MYNQQIYRAVNYENLIVRLRAELAINTRVGSSGGDYTAGEVVELSGLMGCTATYRLPPQFDVNVGIKGDALPKINLNRSGDIIIPIIVGSNQMDYLMRIYNGKIRCDVYIENTANFKEIVWSNGCYCSVTDPLQAETDSPEFRAVSFLAPKLNVNVIRQPDAIFGAIGGGSAPGAAPSSVASALAALAA